MDIDLTIDMHEDILRTTRERARQHVETHIDIMPTTSAGILAFSAMLRDTGGAITGKPRERYDAWCKAIIDELIARLPDDEESGE